jgi:hypothetical protein
MDSVAYIDEAGQISVSGIAACVEAMAAVIALR